MSTYVIEQMQEQGGFTTAYHICNSYTVGKDLRGEILRSFAAQLLQSNQDLAVHVFEHYANKGLEPAIPKLKRLLPELLMTIKDVRFIIDGLDEYPELEQSKILAELIQLTKEPNSQCRVLFSNREGKQIDRVLNVKPTISLQDQHDDVNKDIDVFVQFSLENLRSSFGDVLIGQVQRHIVERAKGELDHPAYLSYLMKWQACFCGLGLYWTASRTVAATMSFFMQFIHYRKALTKRKFSDIRRRRIFLTEIDMSEFCAEFSRTRIKLPPKRLYASWSGLHAHSD